MGAPILHAGASVMCAHGGQATPMSPNPRVRVSGQPITTQSAPYIVAGCPFSTPGGPLPCVTAQWVVGAMRVRAGGMPVLTQSSSAITTPNGVPLTVTAAQPRATAM